MSFDSQRDAMVSTQLIPRGISDERVLGAFRKVPRHEFVPQKSLADAYADYPLPIGEGQTISQPFMVALMTECLALKGTEKVLEVGTGSGYQAAILAELSSKIYSIERIGAIAKTAKAILLNLGYNCEIATGDGTLGWPKHAPFDGIIVTAGSPSIPRSLVDQLSNNGRLVIPVGNEFSQVLTVVKKMDGKIQKNEICGCVFVPLIGKEGWSKNTNA